MKSIDAIAATARSSVERRHGSVVTTNGSRSLRMSPVLQDGVDVDLLLRQRARDGRNDSRPVETTSRR